jgi:large subunit ribosomal protein L4
MKVADVYNLEGEKISQIELPEEIFDVQVKKHVLHQVVQGQLMNKKLGTASTKGRSEVKGSRSKLYRQKGTGRARVGAASSPTRKGGGVAFGPLPHKVLHNTPKKVKKAAVRMALSDKFQSEKLIILNDFVLPEIKTKGFLQVMENFKPGKALIVIEGMNENLERSSKNVPWAKVLRYQGLNTYDLISHEYLFIVQAAIPKVEEALNP